MLGQFLDDLINLRATAILIIGVVGFGCLVALPLDLASPSHAPIISSHHSLPVLTSHCNYPVESQVWFYSGNIGGGRGSRGPSVGRLQSEVEDMEKAMSGTMAQRKRERATTMPITVSHGSFLFSVALLAGPSGGF